MIEDVAKLIIVTWLYKYKMCILVMMVKNSNITTI